MTDNNGYVRFKGLTLSILLIDLMMVCAPVSYAFFIGFWCLKQLLTWSRSDQLFLWLWRYLWSSNECAAINLRNQLPVGINFKVRPMGLTFFIFDSPFLRGWRLKRATGIAWTNLSVIRSTYRRNHIKLGMSENKGMFGGEYENRTRVHGFAIYTNCFLTIG